VRAVIGKSIGGWHPKRTGILPSPCVLNMLIALKNIEENTGQLKGLPKNPRFIRDSRYEDLKQSLIDDPEMTELRELVIYPLPTKKGKYIVIGGNMRLRAMKELGWKEAEAIVLKVETPMAKLREYVNLDNFNPGRFDWDILTNEWEEVELRQDGLEFAWEKIEALDESLFSREGENAADDKKEHDTSLRVIMPNGSEKELQDKVRTKVLAVLEKYPGTKIV